MDPEVEERLRALGYVGATVTRAALVDKSRGDPKDKIGLYNLLKRAGQDSVTGQLDQGIAKVRQVLAADPEVIEAHTMLGNMHSKAERYGEAIAAYQQALAVDPEHEGATWSLALAYRQAGKLDEARAGFERVLELNPRGAKALYQLADLSMRRRDFARAADDAGKGADALRRSRRVSREAGRGAHRAETIRCRRGRAARGDQDQARSVDGALQPGLVYEERQDWPAAATAYEAEIAVSPKLYQPHFNLAKLLSRAGRSADAVDAFPGGRGEESRVWHRLFVPGQGAARRRRSRWRPSNRRSRVSRQSPMPSMTPLGHYVLADVYARQGRESEAARHVAAGKRAERVAGSQERQLMRAAALVVVPGDQHGVCTDGHSRAGSATGAKPGHRHHRYAPGRSRRGLRQHQCRDPEPRSPRSRRRDGASTRRCTCRSRVHRTSRSSRVSTRPSTASATTCRRRSRRKCRCSPRSCNSADFEPARSCRRSCCRSSRVSAADSAHYSDRFEIGEDDARFLNTIQKRGDQTIEGGDGLARRSPAPERRFAWVHLYDPHDPYEPPEPYASRYAGRPYDGEVAWSDELVGRLDAALAAAGVRDDTLLIVTSDHGEGLDEHGEAVHGFFVYETTLRVPFIARGPGSVPGTRARPRGANRRCAADRARSAGPRRCDARRLRPLAETGARAASAWTTSRRLPNRSRPLVHYGWSDLRALRDGRWKYILAPRPELYDLERDPGERQNLADAEPARARALRAGLEQRLRQEQTRVRDPSAARPRRFRPTCSRSWARSATSAWAAGLGGKASGADPEGQDRRVPDAQHADARGARQPARGPLCRQPRALRGTVRAQDRQLRGALLRRARARRA